MQLAKVLCLGVSVLLAVVPCDEALEAIKHHQHHDAAVSADDAAVVTSSGSGLRNGVAVAARGRAKAALRRPKFSHRLRVCNAYPNVAALDVYLSRGRVDKLTGDEAMPYKTCRDFSTPLLAGDKLEFKVAATSAGIFSVSDLPNNDAVLLLVIHRHDTFSSAASFESHVFANLLNAQVAVIDTYKGKTRSHPYIMHPGAEEHREVLRFNSVVAVNAGQYEVKFESPSRNVTGDLVALNRESYVVLRVGAESDYGAPSPEDLVIFPHSDPALLRSGARGLKAPCTAAWLLAVAVVAISQACGA